MKNQPLLLAVMAFSLFAGATPAEARFKFAFAQSLSPGVNGICWRTLEPTKKVSLYRVTANGETKLGEFDDSRDSFVDSGSFQPGEIVRYRLAEVDGAKEISSTPLAAINSAELIANGDFEAPPEKPLTWTGFGISMPAPLHAEVAQGGMPPGHSYLQVTIPDGKLKYSIRSPFVWVHPPTKYTFSFWTTIPSPVLAKGSITIYTKTIEKSAFAKVTWYRLSPAQQKDGWVKITAPRTPFPDERLAGFEISPEQSDGSGSIGVDQFSIIDHDIEYLKTVSVSKSIEYARSGARKFPELAPPDLSAILNEIEKVQTSMTSPSISVDAFLDERSKLCGLLHRLDSINTVFEIAEMP
jgi:hypothetical protein